MSQGSSTVPPPPTGEPQTDVQGAGDNSGMDRFRSIISRLSGGGTPAINKALEQHHAQVLADAQRHSETAKRYYGMVAKAKATGNNPLTGKPATPEEIAQWQQMADGAWADYTKIAGKSKQAKPIIAQVGGLLKHITGGGGGGQQAQGQGQPQSGAAAQPSPQGGPQSLPPGTPGTPIDNGPGKPWTGPVPGTPPTTQGSQTVPPPPQGQSQPKATVPPPPGMNPLQESTMLETSAAAQKEQDELRQKTNLAGGVKQAEEEGQYGGMEEALIKIGKRAGMSDEEAALQANKVIMAKAGGAGMRATQQHGHPVLVDDPVNFGEQMFAIQATVPDENGAYPVKDTDGNIIANPRHMLPSLLPTQSSSSSTYNADTGTTSTSHTSQKVAPSDGGGGSGNRTTGRAGSSRTSSNGRGRVTPPPGSAGEGRVATMAHAWAASGIEPSAKDKPFVEKYMDEHQMQPVQKPTAVERKLNDDIKKVEPMVDKLESFLEDNKLTDAGQGGMFSPSAWYERSKVAKAWEEYSHGLAPKDKQLGQLIKYAAAIKIMGAAPWMTIGRGRYIYSEVVQHLPEPTDTPAQLYEKVQFFRTVLEDARGSLPSSLTGGGGGDAGAPANPYR